MSSRLPEDDRITALMHAYLDAEYRWGRHGEWFPLQIGENAAELEAAFPRARQFGLLSAWNPQSVPQTEPENRIADAALHAALVDMGATFRAGFASARNRSWREPSWVMVDVAIEDLDALAGRFGQLGTLHGLRGEPIRLQMHCDRPAHAPDLPDVVWRGAPPR